MKFVILIMMLTTSTFIGLNCIVQDFNNCMIKKFNNKFHVENFYKDQGVKEYERIFFKSAIGAWR